MSTGWMMTPEELKRVGERINNLCNVREGWTRPDDTLSPRVLQERLPTGVATGAGLTQEELDYMVAGYYQARGWDPDGLVPRSQREELGLLDQGVGACFPGHLMSGLETVVKFELR
jgi:aldehyde:ferredoxin oxidoreductase